MCSPNYSLYFTFYSLSLSLYSLYFTCYSLCDSLLRPELVRPAPIGDLFGIYKGSHWDQFIGIYRVDKWITLRTFSLIGMPTPSSTGIYIRSLLQINHRYRPLSISLHLCTNESLEAQWGITLTL